MSERDPGPKPWEEMRMIPPHTPWSAAQPPSPLRLQALGWPTEDMARPSKEFCSRCTADLGGEGDLGAPGDSGLLRAGAGRPWWGQGRR